MLCTAYIATGTMYAPPARKANSMVLRRVDLLRQVLRVISDVDYVEENGYIVFGAEAVSSEKGLAKS